MNKLYEKKAVRRNLIHAGLSAMVICLMSAGLVAQTFPTPTGFTLPPGKTIVITYDTDVNANACSPGTVPPANLSNQASVSGSFPGSPKLTDDPALPGATDPTLTPFAGLTIGNLVYNDVNRNGVFDGGDTGINGVALNLYQDVNNNNMLDAGDGAAIASTTTANMSGQDGRYAFSICPGTYIVQVALSNFTMGGALFNAGVPFVSSPLSGAGDPDVDLDDNDDNGDPVSGFGVATTAFTISADNNNIDFGFKMPTGISIGNVTMNEGTGGTTTSFNFTVTRTSVEDAINLTVNTMDGTAGSPGDFAAITGGTVSFPAGMDPTQTVTVLVNHDNIVETNETFTVVLSGAPPHANITDNSGLGTITNDDAATVTLSAPVSQLEGNAGTTQYVFTATLNNPVQNGFMVPYTINSGTAMFADLDMTGPNSSLTFAGTAGEMETISVQINGDAKVELDEMFSVTLGAPTVAGVTISGSPATGTITNDDQATVTISNVSMNEGNAGPSNFNFTITLNGVVDAPVTFNVGTVDGSALVANNDYNLTVGGLTFPANGPATQVEGAAIVVNGDMTFEPNETFLVRLSSLAASGRNVVFSPGGATLDGTGTILNDDLPPVLINEVDADQPGTDAAEFVELYDGGVGNTSLNGLVLVFYNGSNDLSYRAIDLDGFTTDANGYFLAGNAGVAGVGVTFPNDILQNGQDAVALYTANGTDFPTNTPVTLTNLIDAVVYDTDDADDAGLLVLLNAGQPQVNENGGGNGTCHSIQRIPNGSGGPRNTSTYQALPPTPKAANFVPEVSIMVSPASVLEDGVTDLTYTITRTGSTACDLPVSFTVSGTAASGTDYPAIAASPITIPAGSATATIVVNPNTDNTVELDETVIITLTDGALYDLSTGFAATGTITNDDNTTLTLSQPAGASQNEGNAGPTPFVYRVTLSNPVQGGFRVNYTTNNGTATTADNDYVDNDGFLDFTGTAGEFHEFTVNVNGDTKVEADETIQTEMVSLSLISVNPVNVVFSGSPFISTILNDDAATLTIVPVSQNEGTGGTTDFNFAVTLNPAVQGGFGLNFVVNDGTATDADDFDVITTSPLAFAGNPGETHNIVVRVSADNKVEANETFEVELVSLSLMSVDPLDVTFSGSPATGTITNDDNATVTLTPAMGISQNEGNTGTTSYNFTATLNNPVQGGFVLSYTTDDGSATTANNDYQDNDGNLNFMGTANETKPITVLVNGDFIVEVDEFFTVSLGTFSGNTPVQLAALSKVGSPQTGNILNDEVDWGDAPTSAQTGFANSYPTTLAQNGARHTTTLNIRLGATIDGETDGQPNATATGDGADEDGVTLPGAFIVGTTASIVVNASATNSRLDAWVDFNRDGIWNNDASERIFSATNLLAGNNTLTFAVPPGASLGTSFARFRVSAAGGLPPTGIASTGEVEDYQVNIANTQFSIDDPVAIAEGNVGTTDLVFTVSRSNTSNACSVEFSVTGGTATIGDGDFTLITASPINFTAGGDPTASIIVRVNGDTKVELDETVEISLSNPVNGSILDGLGIGTINNDDAATLSITSPTVTEGDMGTQNMTFDLSLSNPSDANVVVNFATMNGTATTADLDYQSNSGNHTFTPGQTTKQVVVLINGDCKIEPNEQFIVQLSSLNANSRSITLSGGGSTLNGTGTINNNDAAPMITCPGPITISCDASQLPANTGMATATDNCGPITFGYTDAITPGSCAGNYTIARTWKATDNTGDMSTCVQTITVVDNTPPTPVCLNNTVFLSGGGAYTLQPSDVLNMNATTDNCGTVSVFSITPATVTCAQLNQTISVVVVVKDDCGNSAQCTATITVQEDTALPPGWNTGNVGATNGSSIFSPCTGENGAFVLTATGFSTSSSDVLHTAYQQICGNTTVTARIVNVSGGGWGGVMIRENLMPGSKKVGMKTQLTTNIRREIRSVTNGAAAILNYIRPGHTWLRLERSGSNFVGYSSPNGVSWNFAFAATVSMTGCVYVGIFSESINNAVVNTATFDNVIVTGTPLLLAGNFNPLPVAESGDEVQVYPNPTTGELNIDLDVHTGKPGVVQVFNVLGELVTQERLVIGEVDPIRMYIKGSAGVYTVVIQLDDQRIVRRVVVNPNSGN